MSGRVCYFSLKMPYVREWAGPKRLGNYNIHLISYEKCVKF